MPEGGFDLAYSSLALHYVESFEWLIGRPLVPSARFVFSIELPIYMAPMPGWIGGADGPRAWPLDSYLREGPRSTDWLAKGVIKHHRTLATTINTLICRGFAIRHVEERKPTPDQIAASPQLAEELDRPMFSLVAAERGAG